MIEKLLGMTDLLYTELIIRNACKKENSIENFLKQYIQSQIVLTLSKVVCLNSEFYTSLQS